MAASVNHAPETSMIVNLILFARETTSGMSRQSMGYAFILVMSRMGMPVTWAMKKKVVRRALIVTTTSTMSEASQVLTKNLCSVLISDSACLKWA